MATKRWMLPMSIRIRHRHVGFDSDGERTDN